MSGSEISSAGLDVRRRRIMFRAWHRGTREMDLIMGRFADAHIETLTEDEVTAFEQMLLIEDPDLFNWVSGSIPAPDDVATPLFRRIQDWHLAGGSLPD
ncbi:succinate dehydrogenase assembly factor 2 [Xanthobacteraceae bacterium A53D]